MHISKKVLWLMLTFLTVGFAMVSTTLFIKGNATFGINNEDWNIYFSEAILDNIDKTNVVISDDGKTINFEAKELTKLGETSVLQYEVTNDSKEYDAEVIVTCESLSSSGYTSYTNSMDNSIVPAQTKANGVLTITLDRSYIGEEDLIEEYKCTLDVNAVETTIVADDAIEMKTYYINAYLSDTSNNYISDATVIVFGDTIQYAETDIRGFFHITGLEGGDHKIYVIEGKTIEELKNLTEDEIKLMATHIGEFNTSLHSIQFTDGIYSEEVTTGLGEPNTFDITLDVNGGNSNNENILVVENQPIGRLPIIEHDTLLFQGWYDDDTEYTRNTTVTDSIPSILKAHYGNGVAAIGTKEFRTIQAAVDYITTDEQTEIDVIASHHLYENIITSRNIILDLNEHTIEFDKYHLDNHGTLVIDNGTIDADGSYMFVTDTNLTLNSKLKLNKTDSYHTLSTTSPAIIVENGGEVNVNGTTITGHYSTDSSSLIESKGVVNVNSGNFEVLGEAYGIIYSYNGNINISGGTFIGTEVDGEIIGGSSGTTITIGSPSNTIYFTGNPLNDSDILWTKGTMNITEGTIIGKDGYLIGVAGITNIGSEEKKPILSTSSGFETLYIYSGGTANIYNAEMSSDEMRTMYVKSDGNLNIYDGTFIKTGTENLNRIIWNYGNLNIEGGTFIPKEDSYGILEAKGNSINTITGGTFNGEEACSNLFYLEPETTINVGKDDKDILIKRNWDHSYPIIFTEGKGNINGGNIETDGEFLMLDSQSVVNIYGGTIHATEWEAFYLNPGGVLNIYDGNFTQENNGGTDRLIYSYGTVNINGGTFTAKGTSYGIVQTNQDTEVNINGGFYDNSEGTGNAIYARTDSVINIKNVDETLIFKQSISSGETFLYTDDTVYVENVQIDGIGRMFAVEQKGYFKNVEIEIYDGNFIEVYEEAIVDVYNATVNQDNPTASELMFWTDATLNIYDGSYTISGVAPGMIIIGSDGTLNLESGTFNALNAEGTIVTGQYASSTINLGVEGKNINISNSTKYYCINNIGETNFNGGTLNVTGYLFTTRGTININGGTLTSDEYPLITTQKTGIANINGGILNLNSNTKTNRMIGNNGTLNIYDGMFNVSGASYGLLNAYEGSTTNILGGTLDNSLGTGLAVYEYESATINLGSQNSEIIMKSSPSNTFITAYGELNILGGKYEGSGYIFSIRETGILNITDGEFNITDGRLLYTYAGSQTEITNLKATLNNAEITTRMCNFFGNVTIKNADLKTIGKTYGALQFNENSESIIENITLDAKESNGNAIYINADAKLTIGGEGKLVNMISSSNNAIIYNYGEVYIPAGTFNSSNGVLIGSSNILKIGTETTTPIFNIEYLSRLVNTNENGVTDIYNAKVTSYNNRVFYTNTGGTLNIHNAEVTTLSENNVEQRMFGIYGTVNVYDGTYKVGGEGFGTFHLWEGALVNIFGGTFEYPSQSSNQIYITPGATMNIGELNSSKTLKILPKEDGISSGPTIVVAGTLNVYSGYIYSESSNVIDTADDAIEPIINIYGGTIESNGSVATIYINIGTFTMSGGTVSNLNTGYTIYNKGGTATQSGGVSNKNYNVTVS